MRSPQTRFYHFSHLLAIFLKTAVLFPGAAISSPTHERRRERGRKSLFRKRAGEHVAINLPISALTPASFKARGGAFALDAFLNFVT